MPTPIVNRLLWIVMLGTLAVLAYTFDVSVYMGSGKLTVQADPDDERTIDLEMARRDRATDAGEIG